MTDHLTLPEVLAVHADQIARYGGRPGLRGSGHLEAALFRAKTGRYVDVVEEAAALWESLAQYRPFIDGNGRTAFASAYTFLAVNGTRLAANSEQAYAFMADLYPTNGFSFEVLVPWLREHASGETLR
jgi:death on curing protein